MSNEETLQEYNTNLAGNNEALKGVLNMINELPDANLTGYATIEYVDEAIANNVPEIDLTGYATTEYVDDSNLGLVILNKLSLGSSPGYGSGIVDETTLNKILNGILKGGNYPPAILANNGQKSILFTLNSTSTSNQYKIFYYWGIHLLDEKTNTYEVHSLSFQINGMGYMSSDTKTISNVNTSFKYINRSLNTDNTISYTPTADYHPSTKKYVDDSIKASKTYSTEETVVGTWIDGKPLYRKVIQTDTVTLSSGSNNLADLDTTCIVKYLQGIFHSDNGQFILGSDSSEINHKGDKIVVKTTTDWGSGYVEIVAEYTKTTDTGTEVE